MLFCSVKENTYKLFLNKQVMIIAANNNTLNEPGIMEGSPPISFSGFRICGQGSSG